MKVSAYGLKNKPSNHIALKVHQLSLIEVCQVHMCVLLDDDQQQIYMSHLNSIANEIQFIPRALRRFNYSFGSIFT